MVGPSTQCEVRGGGRLGGAAFYDPAACRPPSAPSRPPPEDPRGPVTGSRREESRRDAAGRDGAGNARWPHGVRGLVGKGLLSVRHCYGETAWGGVPVGLNRVGCGAPLAFQVYAGRFLWGWRCEQGCEPLVFLFPAANERLGA